MQWELSQARPVDHTFWLWIGGKASCLRDWHYWGHNLVPVTRSISLERVLRRARLTLTVHATWHQDLIWVDGAALRLQDSAILLVGGGRGPLAEELALERLEDPFRIDDQGGTAERRPIKLVFCADGLDHGPVRSSRLSSQEAAERLVQGVESRLQHAEVFHAVRWALESASCYKVEGDAREFVRRVRSALPQD